LSQDAADRHQSGSPRRLVVDISRSVARLERTRHRLFAWRVRVSAGSLHGGDSAPRRETAFGAGRDRTLPVVAGSAARSGGVFRRTAQPRGLSGYGRCGVIIALLLLIVPAARAEQPLQWHRRAEMTFGVFDAAGSLRGDKTIVVTGGLMQS